MRECLGSAGFAPRAAGVLGNPLDFGGAELRGSEDGTGMSERPSSFDYQQLLACGRGEMFPEGPQLPLPPMLMFDRITSITEDGGESGKGEVVAEFDREAVRRHQGSSNAAGPRVIS